MLVLPQTRFLLRRRRGVSFGKSHGKIDRAARSAEPGSAGISFRCGRSGSGIRRTLLPWSGWRPEAHRCFREHQRRVRQCSPKPEKMPKDPRSGFWGDPPVDLWAPNRTGPNIVPSFSLSAGERVSMCAIRRVVTCYGLGEGDRRCMDYESSPGARFRCLSSRMPRGRRRRRSPLCRLPGPSHVHGRAAPAGFPQSSLKLSLPRWAPLWCRLLGPSFPIAGCTSCTGLSPALGPAVFFAIVPCPSCDYGIRRAIRGHPWPTA